VSEQLIIKYHLSTSDMGMGDSFNCLQ